MSPTDVARLAVLATPATRYDKVYIKVRAAFDDLCQDPQLSWQEAFRRHELPVNSLDFKVSLFYRSGCLEKLMVEGKIDRVDFVGQCKHTSDV